MEHELRICRQILEIESARQTSPSTCTWAARLQKLPDAVFVELCPFALSRRRVLNGGLQYFSFPLGGVQKRLLHHPRRLVIHVPRVEVRETVPSSAAE